MTYSDNAFATIETSGTTKLGNEARIIGTKGEIIVSKFNDNVKCITFEIQTNSLTLAGKFLESHRADRH